MGTIKFYKDEPIFGLDIGHASLKAMQIDRDTGSIPTIIGYGTSSYVPGTIQNGVIVNQEVIAAAMHQLFEKNLVGNINSRRVACSLPTAHTFSRPMKIPPMDHNEIKEAVRLEAEQYIPIPINSLYLDYEISRQDEQGIELLLVATSKLIVDSYMQLLESLDLEPVAFEPSINAVSRLLQIQGDFTAEPAILIDIGSVTTDIAIFDKNLLVSSTVNSGGDTLTDLVAKSFRMSEEQASKLKNEVGIAFSDKQQRIIDAIKPVLESLVHEVQKSIRYYSERTTNSGKKISRIITVGGGAVMPGLDHYLSKELRLPISSLEPWQKISWGDLTAPSQIDRSTYITAAGQAILNPSEVTK
jgi:type IV pilus assembly protein PilM